MSVILLAIWAFNLTLVIFARPIVRLVEEWHWQRYWEPLLRDDP